MIDIIHTICGVKAFMSKEKETGEPMMKYFLYTTKPFGSDEGFGCETNSMYCEHPKYQEMFGDFLPEKLVGKKVLVENGFKGSIANMVLLENFMDSLS